MTRVQARAAAISAAAVLIVIAVIIARYAPDDPPPRTVPPAPSQPEIPDSPEMKAAREFAKPRPIPDRIILTWKGDPTTTQAVTWRTDTSVTQAGAQIALADPGPGVEPDPGLGQVWKNYDPKKIGHFAARTEPLKSAMNEAHYHSVNFENLRPGTKYMYRVGDGNAWSEWFQFETASATPEPFGFVYFGDAQNGIKSLWSRVVRGSYSDLPRARFIVHAGDLVNNGNDDAQWGEWHTAAGWINGVVPSVPVPGNHEFIGKTVAHWRPQFTLSENGPAGLEETCYYFDFQGTRIIVLNSNEKHAEQTPWLEKVLDSRPKSIRWTVVTFHHPLYSTSPGRDNKAVRAAWRPVLDKYNVDLVLQGHDHGYGRSGLMRDDKLLTDEQARTGRGTVFAVSVSGTKMYGLAKLEWAKRSAANLQLYQLIRIDGGVLKYESRTARGDLFDAFELRKRPDGGNDLIELPVPPAPQPEVSNWPEGTPLVARLPAPAPSAPPAPAPATTAPPDESSVGRGIAAAVILGTIGLGVVAAVRGARRIPRG